MGGREKLSGVIAGIGCRRGCAATAIVAIVHHACEQVRRSADTLAVPEFKSHEPGPTQAARDLGLALVVVPDAALAAAQARCPTRSARATSAVGFASVAEAAALAAAGPGGRLLLARIAANGATCALAEAP